MELLLKHKEGLLNNKAAGQDQPAAQRQNVGMQPTNSQAPVRLPATIPQQVRSTLLGIP